MRISRTFENDNNNQHHPNTFKIFIYIWNSKKIIQKHFPFNLLSVLPCCTQTEIKLAENNYECLWKQSILRKYGKKESIQKIFFNEIPDKHFFMSLCNKKEWASLTRLTDIQLAWFLLRSKQKFVLGKPFYDVAAIIPPKMLSFAKKELCECFKLFLSKNSLSSTMNTWNFEKLKWYSNQINDFRKSNVNSSWNPCSYTVHTGTKHNISKNFLLKKCCF